jgi:dTDP-4-dehydrorhamnose reductase
MILLFGSDTMIGEEVKNCFDESLHVIPIKSSDINITDSDNLEKIIGDFQPGILINCIEYSNIVRAEYMREEAYNVNGFAAKKIADICCRDNIKFVHISTSYIFNGENSNPYSENDNPDPLSVFGDSKLLGEKLIRESCCKSLIVRVPDVFGVRSSFLQSIMKRVRNFGSIKVIKGQYISPISSIDVAESLHEMVKNNSEGTFHLSSSDFTTASKFVMDGLDIYSRTTGDNIDFEIIEKDFREYKIIAERPPFNVLDPSKFSATTGSKMKDWKKSLNDFIVRNGAKI